MANSVKDKKTGAWRRDKRTKTARIESGKFTEKESDAIFSLVFGVILLPLYLIYWISSKSFYTAIDIFKFFWWVIKTILWLLKSIYKIVFWLPKVIFRLIFKGYDI